MSFDHPLITSLPLSVHIMPATAYQDLMLACAY